MRCSEDDDCELPDVCPGKGDCDHYRSRYQAQFCPGLGRAAAFVVALHEIVSQARAYGSLRNGAAAPPPISGAASSRAEGRLTTVAPIQPYCIRKVPSR